MINDIEALRKSLPASPYRDDLPHITLLRGVTSPLALSDDELTINIEKIVGLSDNLPLTATVSAIVNKSNQFYSSSGLILLDTSSELRSFRQNVVAQLEQHAYEVEKQELDTFTPHMTIRLGVPLGGDELEQAEKLFNDRVVTFSRWLLFRLVREDNQRIMRYAWPH